MTAARPLAIALTALLAAVAAAGCYGPPTGPPQVTGQVTLTVNSAAWAFEYPTGLIHAVRGELYLNVNVTLHNAGSIVAAILAAEFSVYWSGQTVGIPAMATSVTTTIPAGGTLSGTVTFLSTEVRTPTTLEFRQAGFTNTVTANIPAPSALPQEVVFSAVSTSWTSKDAANQSAASGSAFFWVNFTLANQWHGSVDLNTFNFKVKDAGGTDHAADGRVGPPSVAAGATANASFDFEVPTSFVAVTLLYDDILGPFTDVALTAAVFPVPSLGISAGSWMNGNLSVSVYAAANASGLDPVGLRYVVKSNNGTLYFSGAAGNESLGPDANVSVKYFDNLDTGSSSPGDTIMVTVSPATSTAIMGGSFEVYSGSLKIGALALP